MEQTEKENVRIGVFMDKAVLEQRDNAIPKTNAQSRSEFICDAIDFYVAWLNAEVNSKVLTPALESVIGAKIQDTENRLARVLFKQGVELAMLMNVIAGTNEIDEHTLAELRKHCANEVSRLSGRYLRNPNVVLKSLQSNACKQAYKYERLYRNLYNAEFFLRAYQNIYAREGNMTAGTDGKTIDGMGMERINGIIEKLKNHSYQPKPARREYIKKKNSTKMRPLGIPSADDKLVQEVVRMLLV